LSLGDHHETGQIFLEKGYLAEKYGVTDASGLLDAVFDGQAAFREMVRAGEGVVRDFINIFSSAYFLGVARGEGALSVGTVREAAREWFEKDKAPNIDRRQTAALDFMRREVIGKKRARSFLMEKRYERYDVIRSLFDYRLLHIIERGYADKDDPSVRYNIYTLDYGLYVDLIGTHKAPEGDFSAALKRHRNEDIVPVDNRRWIRRIILTPAQLDEVTGRDGADVQLPPRK
jgi:hypothetical protein